MAYRGRFEGLELERSAPVSGCALAACAGSYLYGRALIVGAGRFVAARVALLANHKTKVTALERDKRMIVEFGFEDPRLTVAVADVCDWNPDHEFESCFFDLWPIGAKEREQLIRALSWVNVKGRMVFISDYHPVRLEGWESFDVAYPGERLHLSGGTGVCVYHRVY